MSYTLYNDILYYRYNVIKKLILIKRNYVL